MGKIVASAKPGERGVVDLKDAMDIRMDAWNNIFTGHGTTRDKMTYTEFESDDLLGDETLGNIYHHDDMAARACDAVPEEMLRRGFSLESDDLKSEDIKDITDVLDKIKVISKAVEASVWARVYGGCLWFVGADDGARGPDLAEPLNEDGVKVVDHINVIEKQYAMPNRWYSDPSHPKFGEPETYLITPYGSGGTVSVDAMEVHESRTIRFDGLRASATYRQRNNGWGLSLIQRMHWILKSFGMSFEGLANLLADANQGVFLMKGLFEALAARDYDTIHRRMQLLDMSRSEVRSIVLDAENEQFQRQNFNWSGIKEPFTMLMLRLSAAARVPVTVLMGQSPAGMDATGESDIRWFYDQTESKRGEYLDPKLNEILRLVMLSKQGPTGGNEIDDYTLTYPPLWQATEKEMADIREAQSRTDKNYIDAGVLAPTEVALCRFTQNGWSAETTIDLEAREAMLKDDVEDLGKDPEPPVPPQQLGNPEQFDEPEPDPAK